MISKRIAIFVFSLMLLATLMSYGQEIERNPKGAYFEVGNDESIKEWLMIDPFPKEIETDFLHAQGGEANIRPDEGMTVTAPDGKTYTWKSGG
ncbi:hypothetical protein HYR99_06460 [Candidatus Poribacteria bacterium]|nr:hypothetical protein [Candidatus Poribacteria bacterium]